MSDSLEKDQEQLGRALERAAAGEDRDLATWVREKGERFVRLLYGLLRMTHIHALENAAFTKPIQDLQSTVRDLMETLGALHLVTVEDQVFLNDIRIRLGRGEEGADLGSELRRHNVGGLSIHALPDEARLRALVELFAAKPHGANPRVALMEALTARGFDSLDLFGIYRFRVTGDAADQSAPKRDAKKISSRAAELAEESWDNLGSGRMPNPLPMRRVVTEILESGSDSDSLAEGGVGGGRYGVHAMQVCRLALTLGQAAGLSDEAVQDLGVAAMFHDMGYAAREGADPKSGDPGYPPPFERHPAAGARLLLRQRGFHQAKINRALTTLEHHRDYDDKRGKPCLFARIVRIAEDYANYTRRDAGGLPPRTALARMAARAGTAYDPVLMQIFVNTLGAYPPGTLLQLQGGYVVVSRSLARSPATFDRPLARLVRLPDGRAPDKVMSIDLAEKGRVIGVLDDLPDPSAPDSSAH